MSWDKLPYSYSRDVRGGCFTCHGDGAKWWHKGTQGTAAQHTRKTGHSTWVETEMRVRYHGTGYGGKGTL